MPQENPIRAARLKQKLSQERLGIEVGVTKAAVSSWESGAKLPAPATAIKLAKVLNVSLDQVYGAAANDSQPRAA